MGEDKVTGRKGQLDKGKTIQADRNSMQGNWVQDLGSDYWIPKFIHTRNLDCLRLFEQTGTYYTKRDDAIADGYSEDESIIDLPMKAVGQCWVGLKAGETTGKRLVLIQT